MASSPYGTPRGPPEKNKVYSSVIIDGTGKRGDGVTHINGMAVFVPGVQVGDRVDVVITRIYDTYAVAEKAGGS